jgi:hypothetical protein
VKADACMECHAAELERIDDSHPPAKFTDPRNAERVARLDARSCVACHVEHRPEITLAMGVTQPVDYCRACHDDIAKERPSHEGLAFATCQDAGCHNFHDNRSLHEDYLERHLDDPALLVSAGVPTETRALQALAKPGTAALRADQNDAPADVAVDPQLLRDFAETAHARAGVNCMGCHDSKADPPAFQTRPAIEVCRGCHAEESEGFLASKHGMRLAAGLSAMTPRMARLPMHESAAHRALGCTTCHSAHRFDRAAAAVDGCLSCHADEHSRAYLTSAHHELWQAERSGRGKPGSGVSCATCHLPRVVPLGGGAARVWHNQNDFLRPNEKMIDAVCARCHGVPFALDALADPQVIARGVGGRPRRRVKSVDMVRSKLAQLADGGASR